MMLQSMVCFFGLPYIFLFYNNFFLTAGSNDYTLGMNMLTFTPGEERKCIFVNTTDDNTFEDTEQLNLTLSSPVPHTPSSTTLNITDNDGKLHHHVYVCTGHRGHNDVHTLLCVILRNVYVLKLAKKMCRSLINFIYRCVP